MTTTEEKRGRPKGSPSAPKNKPTVVINGRKVEDLRLARNWSQSELGRRCYITQARVSRIEGGEETPAVDTAWFLAQAFGVKLDDLIEVLEGEG